MEPVIISVTFFLLVFAVFYIFITTRNKERMAMIEKGADPKLFQSVRRSSGYAVFKWGLFMIGLALGILTGALFEHFSELQPEPLYFSMILIFGGLGLVLAYLLQGKLEKNRKE